MKLATIWNKLSYVPAAVALLAGSAIALNAQTPTYGVTKITLIKVIPVKPAVDPAAEEQASELLKDIRGLSMDLNKNADRLEALSRTRQVSWKTYADSLERLKGHINTTGEKLGELREIEASIAPWQKEAIRKMEPVAIGLASNTQAAIEFLNDNKKNLHVQEYRERLAEMATQAGQLKQTASDYLALASAQDKVNSLALKTGFSGY